MIAKMYYIDKIKQNEIARYFNLSSMMVSRILKEAENAGIVSFHVKMPWRLDMEIGGTVLKKYGLDDCFAFDIEDDDETPFKLGSYLADYFSQILPKKNAIVGLSWGNTISKFVKALPYIQVKNCSLVQLTGTFYSISNLVNTSDILNEISKKLDGSRIYLLHAPLYAPSKEVRDSLLNDPVNKIIWQMSEKSDINIIGLSDLSSKSNTLKSGTINEDDFKELSLLNSIGDLAGTFLDSSGDPLHWSKRDFNTGVALHHISRAKRVICVAGEFRKIEILRKTCEKKYFNVLFTTKTIAEELLKQ